MSALQVSLYPTPTFIPRETRYRAQETQEKQGLGAPASPGAMAPSRFLNSSSIAAEPVAE